ncbi:hypothetical protein N0V90_004350 [Kalmusia sp. IMI 367209]|nr:hypothetical protein N0V90_004350 [Kalmusia sp. IMI 367209]
MEPREEVRRFRKESNTQNQDATNEARLDEVRPDKDDTASYLEHYRETGGSVRDILSDIKQDMGSYSNLHNWDDRMINTPNSLVRAACSDYMNKDRSPLDSLLAFGHATEVVTYNGENVAFSTTASSSETIEERLFFTRVSQKNSTRYETDQGSRNPPLTNRCRQVCVHHRRT